MMKTMGSLNGLILALVAILVALVGTTTLTNFQPAQAKAEENRIIPETIGAGGEHTCGVKSDGTLACWGYNYFGDTQAPGGTFTQVSAGDYYTCGLKSDGTLACWGYNGYGQTNAPVG